jgi:hypothetical protein
MKFPTASAMFGKCDDPVTTQARGRPRDDFKKAPPAAKNRPLSPLFHPAEHRIPNAARVANP